MNTQTRDKALQQFPYALLIVGSTMGDSVVAIVGNWATQVSFSPALVAVSIERDSRMRQFIETSGFFSINLLPSKRTELAKTFLKPREASANSINGRKFARAKNGTPFLHDALSSIECKVIQMYPTGDHVTFIGEISDAVVHRDGEALTLRETGLRYQR